MLPKNEAPLGNSETYPFSCPARLLLLLLTPLCLLPDSYTIPKLLATGRSKRVLVRMNWGRNWGGNAFLLGVLRENFLHLGLFSSLKNYGVNISIGFCKTFTPFIIKYSRQLRFSGTRIFVFTPLLKWIHRVSNEIVV